MTKYTISELEKQLTKKTQKELNNLLNNVNQIAFAKIKIKKEERLLALSKCTADTFVAFLGDNDEDANDFVISVLQNLNSSTNIFINKGEYDNIIDFYSSEQKEVYYVNSVHDENEYRLFDRDDLHADVQSSDGTIPIPCSVYSDDYAVKRNESLVECRRTSLLVFKSDATETEDGYWVHDDYREDLYEDRHGNYYYYEENLPEPSTIIQEYHSEVGRYDDSDDNSIWRVGLEIECNLSSEDREDIDDNYTDVHQFLHEYKFVPERDGSLDDTDVEFISNILPADTENELNQITTLVEKLLNFVPSHKENTSNRYGGHIHFSHTDLSPETLYDRLLPYSPVLEAMYQSREGITYAKSIYNNGDKQKIEVRYYSDKKDKYRLLHLTDNTLEVRIFPSPTKAEQPAFRIRLIKAMINSRAETWQDVLTNILDRKSEVYEALSYEYDDTKLLKLIGRANTKARYLDYFKKKKAVINHKLKPKKSDDIKELEKDIIFANSSTKVIEINVHNGEIEKRILGKFTPYRYGDGNAIREGDYCFYSPACSYGEIKHDGSEFYFNEHKLSDVYFLLQHRESHNYLDNGRTRVFNTLLYQYKEFKFGDLIKINGILYLFSVIHNRGEVFRPATNSAPSLSIDYILNNKLPYTKIGNVVDNISLHREYCVVQNNFYLQELNISNDVVGYNKFGDAICINHMIFIDGSTIKGIVTKEKILWEDGSVTDHSNLQNYTIYGTVDGDISRMRKITKNTKFIFNQ